MGNLLCCDVGEIDEWRRSFLKSDERKSRNNTMNLSKRSDDVIPPAFAPQNITVRSSRRKTRAKNDINID